jgi:hypothetical protein
MVSAATIETRRPARVEPVNDTMSTSGCPAMASPTTGPVPCTMLNAPAGSPASAATSARICAVSGAICVRVVGSAYP